MLINSSNFSVLKQRTESMVRDKLHYDVNINAEKYDAREPDSKEGILS